jgi:nuclear GTP-binding protein
MAQKVNGNGRSLAEIVAHAAERAAAFDEYVDQKATDSFGFQETQSFHDNSKRAYYREFQKVVDESDVVLEVLDARDPLGTRALDVEEKIRLSSKKRLILVLNKIGWCEVETAAAGNLC